MMVNFHYAVFNHDLVSLKSLPHSQTFTAAHVKLPAVPATLDNVPAERSLREQRALVRTKILGGIEFAIHIENN